MTPGEKAQIRRLSAATTGDVSTDQGAQLFGQFLGALADFGRQALDDRNAPQPAPRDVQQAAAQPPWGWIAAGVGALVVLVLVLK